MSQLQKANSTAAVILSRQLAGVCALLVVATWGCSLEPHFAASLHITLDEVPTSAVAVQEEVISKDGGSTKPTPTETSIGGEPPARGIGMGGGQPTSPGGPPDLELRVTTGQYRLEWLAGDTVGGNSIGNPARIAQSRQITGITKSAAGTVFFADSENHQIRALTSSGTMSLIAGAQDGTSGYLGDDLPANASRLASPYGLAFDERAGVLLVADRDNDRVRYFAPGGKMYTLAGGGTLEADSVSRAVDARIAQPLGLALTRDGSVIFTEFSTGRIRKVAKNGGLMTLATLPSGRGGPVTTSWADGLIWAADGEQIFCLSIELPQGAVHHSIYRRPGYTVTGLCYDQAGSLFVSASKTGSQGRSDACIFRLSVQEDGTLVPSAIPELVAGAGGESAQQQDYFLPPSILESAEEQLLAGAGFCSILVDLTNGANRLGTIYAGNSYQGIASNNMWSQLMRLTPR